MCQFWDKLSEKTISGCGRARHSTPSTFSLICPNVQNRLQSTTWIMQLSSRVLLKHVSLRDWELNHSFPWLGNTILHSPKNRALHWSVTLLGFLFTCRLVWRKTTRSLLARLQIKWNCVDVYSSRQWQSEIISNNNLSFYCEPDCEPDCLQERDTVMTWDSDTHLRQGIEMDWSVAHGRINWQKSKLIIQRLRYLHENRRWATVSA